MADPVSSILVDGSNTTTTLAGAAIFALILSLPILPKFDERDTTNCTNTTVKTKDLKTLATYDDVKITVDTDLGMLASLPKGNQELIVTFSNGKKFTAWVKYKEAGSLNVGPDEEPKTELTYILTNRNAEGVETPPTLV